MLIIILLSWVWIVVVNFEKIVVGVNFFLLFVEKYEVGKNLDDFLVEDFDFGFLVVFLVFVLFFEFKLLLFCLICFFNGIVDFVIFIGFVKFVFLWRFMIFLSCNKWK